MFGNVPWEQDGEVVKKIEKLREARLRWGGGGGVIGRCINENVKGLDTER